MAFLFPTIPKITDDEVHDLIDRLTHSARRQKDRRVSAPCPWLLMEQAAIVLGRLLDDRQDLRFKISSLGRDS